MLVTVLSSPVLAVAPVETDELDCGRVLVGMADDARRGPFGPA